MKSLRGHAIRRGMECNDAFNTGYHKKPAVIISAKLFVIRTFEIKVLAFAYIGLWKRIVR